MKNDMIEKVRFITHPDYPIDENTRKILDLMADTEGVLNPVVALPDVHFKYSYHTPTGVVVLAKDRIIPKFVNANCGMSFIVTPFFEDEINEKMLDAVFIYLRDRITVTTRTSPVISQDELKGIVRDGALWSVKKFGMDPNDLANFENNGSLLKDDPRDIEDILSFIPGTCRDVGLFSLGVLGFGNHFIEMQKIDDLVNSDIAARFGIKKGQICFMIHSDSRAFGQSIFDFYSKKAKKLMGLQQLYKRWHYRAVSSSSTPEALKKGLEALNRSLNRLKSVAYWKLDKRSKKKSADFKSIEAASPEGVAYETSTYCAINFGYANRAYMASLIRDALNNASGKSKGGFHVLFDGNHDALQKEKIDGASYYVHRNGANRALPPKYFPGHPIFSRTGQPVLLPSALGVHSFLCAATKGCKDAYYSTCHGTGRLIDRGEARQAFRVDEVLKEVKGKGVKVYDYGRGYTAEEAPAAFKNVDKVLETIIKHDIAEPVARMKPLAALKGWR
jgi:tRNA-splicing ligase RtcB (3'-phosphate/5'-hydroxy nucleic acid ligase)